MKRSKTEKKNAWTDRTEGVRGRWLCIDRMEMSGHRCGTPGCSHTFHRSPISRWFLHDVALNGDVKRQYIWILWGNLCYNFIDSKMVVVL
jgi:hypothetical protein